MGGGYILNDNGTIIALSLVFLCSLYLVFIRKKRNLPPGPIGLPFFGYWPFVAKNPHKKLNQLAKKYGNFFGLYLGRKYAVVCNDWPAMKDALSKSETLNRPPETFNQIPLGIGFGSSNGQEWFEQRRFSIKTMKDIGLGRPKWEELVQEEVKEVVTQIRSQAGQSIDLNEVLASTFTNNIMSILMGHRLPYGHTDIKTLSHNIDAVMHESPSLGLGTFLPTLGSFLRKIGVYGSKKAARQIKEFSSYIVKAIETRLQNQEMVDEESFVKTFFQEIQNNKKKKLNNFFTDVSLISNTQSLVLGGSETSRNSFIWLLVSMAEHPEKQDKVHQEIDRVLGKSGIVKWADRMRLPYTFAAIMESMRWKTLVPVGTLRMTSADTKILGYDIPKGTVIVNNMWALHRDARYWPDPEKFEPERFLLDGGKAVNFKPDSYVPFSYGKRSCPGEMIALTEILQYFTTLIQKFKILPQEGDSNVKFKTHLGLTYQPLEVKLRFQSRD